MKLKKIHIIFIVIIVLFIGTLAAAPFFLNGKLKEAVLTAINENVNAKVAFNDVDLSLFKSFPSAALTLSDFQITTNAPFENDTLAFVKELHLNMPIRELFKGKSESIQITDIVVNDAYLNIISNKEGETNYDIMKPSDAKDENDEGTFNFAVKSYEITNSHIKYNDEASNISLELKEFNHSGSGDLSAEKSKLDTKSSAKLSFEFDKVKYFEDNELSLDALIGIDLKTSTFSFLKNEANISGLPLTFDGNVVLLDEGQQIDINFKTPTSSFKNFLAVMPKVYAKNLDNVKTEGDFTVNGTIKGMNNDDRIPNFDINIASNNASFKYPDLPKGVDDITIKALIKNKTGLIKDIFVTIDAFNFRIDEDVFKSSGFLTNLTRNPTINATLKGTINLANISSAYPVKLEEKLSGLLKLDIKTAFDMDAVEKSNYARIKNKGNLMVSDFVYNSEDFASPFNIALASLNFTPELITLKQFNATTGKTDINATGTIKDVIGFVISDKELKGNFNLTSNTFYVNDFRSEVEVDNGETPKKESTLKIPSFLDCTISAEAKTVMYDNLELKNMKGIMFIKDEKVTLKNVTSSLFGGDLALTGTVSTKEEIPTFDMDLGMNAFDIAESFNGLELLKALAPIANVVQGKLNTTFKISGNLDSEFTPDLNSISGNALAQILAQNIDSENSPLLNTLSSQLKFIDLKKLDLKDIKTILTFENGKVNVKPFKLKYNDIDVNIGGNHSFDKLIDYKVTFDVPGKYLGNEVTSLMAKISTEDASEIKVPVTANITGSFSNPSVTTDYKSVVSNLATQLVSSSTLKEKGATILSDLIKVPSKNVDTTKASTPKVDLSKPKEAVNNLVNDKLNSFFGKKKKKKDSVN